MLNVLEMREESSMNSELRVLRYTESSERCRRIEPDNGGPQHCSEPIVRQFRFFVRIRSFFSSVEILLSEEFGDFVGGG
jgi:hypothetical protein